MGLGRGWACIGIQLNYSKTRPGYKDRPSGAAWAEWGRVGPSRAVRAEWGWGGVGHALGFNSITLRLGLGYKDRPSGAAWGRFGPSGAQLGRRAG